MLSSKPRRTQLILLVATWGIAGLAACSVAEDRVLFDFEKKRLSVDWSAVGKIRVNRVPIPAAKEVKGNRPSGKGIIVETEGRGGVFCKSGRVPGDWSKFSELSFWVHRSEKDAKQTPKSVLEIQIYEAGAKAKFWRRITVSHTGWKRVSVPLRWFRWGPKRVPSWDRADRFGFWFRDKAKLSIDNIVLTPGKEKYAAYLGETELAEVAFPKAAKGTVRIVKNEDALLLTDAKAVDVKKLADHLSRVAAAVRKDFPFLMRTVQRPVLIVFSTRNAYQRFPVRFAERFDSNANPPRSGGFTLHGIATSYYEPKYGTLRPVFTHEFVHSLLNRSARIPNAGEWLQEGTASYYQLRFHPQKNLPEIVRSGLAKKTNRLPLETLCSGRRIPTTRYWQAATVIEYLLTDKDRRKQVPALFAAFQKAGATTLGPQLRSVLKTDWGGLETAWQKFCRERYRK